MNNKIIIFNQDSGYLMIDLANAYCDRGYDVTLVTGRIKERSILLNKKVRIARIKKYVRTTAIKRMWSWGVAGLQIFLKVLFHFRDEHLLFVSNPPISAWVNLFVKRDFSLLIYDVYPDALVDVGFLSQNSFILRSWKKVNEHIYRKAKRIITISDSMAETIQPYVFDKKVEVIPIWTDNTYLKPILDKDNLFIKKAGLQGKFIVMYSGNLGATANAEIVLDIACRMRNNADIIFVIIGEGSQKKKIYERLTKEGLSNCLLLPFQNSEDLRFSLAAASLSIVSLTKDAGRIALPSKLYSLLSVGSPILGICGEETTLFKTIVENEIGRCFAEGQIDEIEVYINSLVSSTIMHEKYCENSLKLSKRYDITNVQKFIK